jgi:hypothetical protein
MSACGVQALVTRFIISKAREFAALTKVWGSRWQGADEVPG